MAHIPPLSGANRSDRSSALRPLPRNEELSLPTDAPRNGTATRAETLASEAIKAILGRDTRVHFIAEPVEFTSNLVNATDSGGVGVGAELTSSGHIKILIAVRAGRELFSDLDRPELPVGLVTALQSQGLQFGRRDAQTEVEVPGSRGRSFIRKLHLYFSAL